MAAMIRCALSPSSRRAASVVATSIPGGILAGRPAGQAGSDHIARGGRGLTPSPPSRVPADHADRSAPHAQPRRAQDDEGRLAAPLGSDSASASGGAYGLALTRAGRFRGRGRARRVLELLLGAEERVEHLLAKSLAGDERHARTHESDQEETALAALALLRAAQRLGRVLERVGRDAQLALRLLVLGHGLDRALPVHARVGLLRRLERAAQVLAQLGVLDQPLYVLVRADRLARGKRSGAGLGGLLLRCHCSPRSAFGQRHSTRERCAGTGYAARLVGRRRWSAASSTSSTSSTSTKLILRRRCAGMSSMSASLRRGTISRLIPARCAASAFSFSPPIGSTWPVSVISPVIAVSERTGRPVARDASAVAIVIPALGPSFGIAPAGTCTCTSCSRKKPSGISPFTDLTYESAAAADSFMTSPSCPVTCSLPSPGKAVASTNSTSPPTGVLARPVATPGSFVRRFTSGWNRRLPSSSVTMAGRIDRFERRVPSANSRATLRQTEPISRSSERTPASRV